MPVITKPKLFSLLSGISDEKKHPFLIRLSIGYGQYSSHLADGLEPIGVVMGFV